LLKSKKVRILKLGRNYSSIGAKMRAKIIQALATKPDGSTVKLELLDVQVDSLSDLDYDLRNKLSAEVNENLETVQAWPIKLVSLA
jgi:hypothetical protein